MKAAISSKNGVAELVDGMLHIATPNVAMTMWLMLETEVLVKALVVAPKNKEILNNRLLAIITCSLGRSPNSDNCCPKEQNSNELA